MSKTKKTGEVHKMARHIIAGEDPYEVDLSVSDTVAIRVMQDAFANIIVTANPDLRYTFVVGGGKNCRQKYSDSLSKSCAEALTELGMEHDRHCCDAGEGGKFKFQHDTDKNLKFLHVYPRIEAPPKDEEKTADKKPKYTARQRLTCCSMQLFQEYSDQLDFGELQETLKQFAEWQALIPGILEKLMKQEPVSEEDEEFYGNEPLIKEKIDLINTTIQERIRNGYINKEQRDKLLASMQKKKRKIDKAEKTEAKYRDKKQKKLIKQKPEIEDMIQVLTTMEFREMPAAREARLRRQRIGQEGEDLLDKHAQAVRLKKAWERGKTLNAKQVKLVGKIDTMAKKLKQMGLK